MTRIVISALVCFVFSGCGALGSAACDFRADAGAMHTEDRCQERVESLASAAFKGTCSVAQGVASDGKCPRTGAVGGCETGTQGDGSKVNDWYYPPKTRADAMTECGNGKFLEP